MRTNERTAGSNDLFTAIRLAKWLQSSRGFEATPQSFVRLTGSHLAKPRAIRADIIE
jgi:hypothetical protein